MQKKWFRVWGRVECLVATCVQAESAEEALAAAAGEVVVVQMGERAVGVNAPYELIRKGEVEYHIVEEVKR